MKKLSLVVLISGNGSNLQAIIDAIESGDLNAQIQAVISNRPDAYGLKRAQRHNVPAICIDHRNFSNRDSFDRELQQEIDSFKPDLIVLAGYMRILTSRFIHHYYPRMLNIHPSLLPKYRGLNTHQQVLDNADRIHGVSIHIVTPELDSGPVILQGEFAVKPDDNSASLQSKVHQLEHRMYPIIIQWISEQRLKLAQDSIIFDDNLLQRPIHFNEL